MLKWGGLWFVTKEGRLFKEKTIKLENNYFVNIYVQYGLETYLEYCFEVENHSRFSSKSSFNRGYRHEILDIKACFYKEEIVIVNSKDKDTLAIYNIALKKWRN